MTVSASSASTAATTSPVQQASSRQQQPAGSLASSAWIGQPSPGGIGWAEQGWVPEWLIRRGIRSLLRDRLAEEQVDDIDACTLRQQALMKTLLTAPIAVETEAANHQHYEVPAAFYNVVLGPHRKYSSCYFAKGVTDLGQAEADMLALTCERADLHNGQAILEIGCGWGSLTLFMAAAYPQATITAVSNSHRQREFICAEAQRRGLSNIHVITANIIDFAPKNMFDRIVSVECFEHMRNHKVLFARLATWLRDEGRVFVHVFTHRTVTYLFEDKGDDDWMSRHFFSGGIMPSDSYFLHLQDDVRCEQHWQVSGLHYAKTAEAWLERINAHKRDVQDIFIADGLGPQAAKLQMNRWRIFFIACAELWGFRKGSEWMVSHYRFTKHARGVT